MITAPPHEPHTWYTPSDIASTLEGKQHGRQWRAKCPVHSGDNPQSLGIAQGLDHHGNPCTLLYCYAHQCAITDICAALGIAVKNLFCILPSHARETQYLPRTHSPRLARIKAIEEPPKDTVAHWLLAEMIISDPEWIETCAPARAQLWKLAQASPRSRAQFTQCLRDAGLHPFPFWQTLAREMEG